MWVLKKKKDCECSKQLLMVISGYWTSRWLFIIISYYFVFSKWAHITFIMRKNSRKQKRVVGGQDKSGVRDRIKKPIPECSKSVFHYCQRKLNNYRNNSRKRWSCYKVIAIMAPWEWRSSWKWSQWNGISRVDHIVPQMVSVQSCPVWYSVTTAMSSQR